MSQQDYYTLCVKICKPKFMILEKENKKRWLRLHLLSGNGFPI